MATQRIPQELLINLAKQGRQPLIDLLLSLGQREQLSEREGYEDMPYVEKGYSLEDYPIEEGVFGGGRSMPSWLTEGTSRDPMYTTPIEEMSAYAGGYGEKEELGTHWAIDNLIRNLEQERIVTEIEDNPRSGIYGQYDDRYEPHTALINIQSPEDIRYESEWANEEEHYLNTLIHETFLHGLGGGHGSSGGVTFQGWQPEYEKMGQNFIKSLEEALVEKKNLIPKAINPHTRRMREEALEKEDALEAIKSYLNASIGN